MSVQKPSNPSIRLSSTKAMCWVKRQKLHPLNCLPCPSGHPDTSYVTGGFYSNWFDGIIKFANETWHVEPSRKYSATLPNTGPSIIYNVLDVDIATFDRAEARRHERHVRDQTSSFCALDDERIRARMQAESDRLDDDRTEFKSRYIRPKRQSTNGPEQSCCQIYIRVDPTLWDTIYKNEGLNV